MFRRSRPKRRFVPGLGFDSLESRVCLDGADMPDPTADDPSSAPMVDMTTFDTGMDALECDDDPGAVGGTGSYQAPTKESLDEQIFAQQTALYTKMKTRIGNTRDKISKTNKEISALNNSMTQLSAQQILNPTNFGLTLQIADTAVGLARANAVVQELNDRLKEQYEIINEITNAFNELYQDEEVMYSPDMGDGSLITVDYWYVNEVTWTGGLA